MRRDEPGARDAGVHRVIGVGELPLEWADAVWEHNNCEDRSSLDIVYPTVP